MDNELDSSTTWSSTKGAEPLRPWYVIIVLACLLVGILLLLLPYTLGLTGRLDVLSSQLGGAVIAAAAVSFVYDYYLRRHFMRVVGAQTRSLAGEILPITKKLRGVGLVDVHLDRDSIPWYDLVYGARSEVAILGTSLGFWANLPNISRALGNAIQNGARVRLLALRPQSSYAEERGHAISVYPDAGDFFARDIEGSVAALRNMNSAITAKYYSELPTCVVLILDERIIVNFVLRGLRGREAVHFEFRRSSERAQKFLQHFEAVWKSGTEVKDQTEETAEPASQADS